MAWLLLLLLLCVLLMLSSSKGKQGPRRTSRKPKRFLQSESQNHNRIEVLSEQETDSGVEFLIAPPRNTNADYLSWRIIVPKGSCCVIDVISEDPDHPQRFNVKTRKWKYEWWMGGSTPFESKAPKEFLDFLVAQWEAVNGPIPTGKRTQRNSSVDVEFQRLFPRIDIDLLASKFPTPFPIVSSTSGNTYTVDLSHLTCTCPDFTERRSSLEPTSPGRLCKHLVRALDDRWIVAKDCFPGPMLLTEIAKLRNIEKGMDTSAVYGKCKVFYEGGEIEFDVLYRDQGWINVFYTQNGHCKRFGYSYEQRRWARRENPFPPGLRRSINSKLQKLCKPDSAEKDAPIFSESRILCEDGSCIGILDENGVCTQCRRTPDQIRTDVKGISSPPVSAESDTHDSLVYHGEVGINLLWKAVGLILGLCSVALGVMLFSLQPLASLLLFIASLLLLPPSRNLLYRVTGTSISPLLRAVFLLFLFISSFALTGKNIGEKFSTGASKSRIPPVQEHQETTLPQTIAKTVPNDSRQEKAEVRAVEEEQGSLAKPREGGSKYIDGVETKPKSTPSKAIQKKNKKR